LIWIFKKSNFKNKEENHIFKTKFKYLKYIMEKTKNLENDIIKTIETLRQLQIMLENYDNEIEDTWKNQMYLFFFLIQNNFIK
jgi:hypothetical protein